MSENNETISSLWLQLQDVRKQIRDLEKQKTVLTGEVIKLFGRKRILKLDNGTFLSRKKVRVEEHVIPTYEYDKLTEIKK
jgi:hypothetical protein